MNRASSEPVPEVAQAALEAEVDRVYLYRLMRKHPLKAKA